MSLTHPNHAVTEQRLSEFYQAIMPYLNGEPQKIVYGFRIDNAESVPSAKVTYLEDAVGMTPAYMNFSTGKFDYGSWEEAFFMPKPCMLKYDGTVDYYLDPNDYTKKEDGVTASDVANTSYGGNAMIEWPKIWLKIVPDATASNKSADIYIANYKADADYTDWSYHNSAGVSMGHFYTAIYNGSLVDNTLRSLSGQQVMNKKTAQQELDYATANNPTGSLIWTTNTISEVDLITILLILISKSTDHQDSFGKGLGENNSESIFNSFRTGVQNDKGLFYGTNSGEYSTYTNAVKVFGMENWWGFQWKRILGLVSINGSRKIKLSYGQEDGSTVTGYNFTGNGYINSGISAMSGESSKYIEEIIFSEKGLFPIKVSSTATYTTYYCDTSYFDNSITSILVKSGVGGKGPGSFTYRLDMPADSSNWATGVNLSAKPLAVTE